MSDKQRWMDAGSPMPTSAIRVESGECAYDCERTADFLVKVENTRGTTSKFRVCESCNDENRIWAERYLPSDSPSETTEQNDGGPDT